MWKITESVAKLKEFLESAAINRAGQKISYDEITDSTGIEMNQKGKGYLRNAAKYCGVEYSSIPKYGIEIAGPENSTDIMGGRLVRIDRATRRAETASKNISNRYLSEMSEDDRKSIIMIASVLGAVRAAADQYKRTIKYRKALPVPVNTD